MVRKHRSSSIATFLAILGRFISILLVNYTHTITSTEAYEIGCIYPRRMLEPFAARAKILGFTGVYSGTGGTNSAGNTNSGGLETPIAVHQGQAFSYCDVNCLAYHDSSALNGITQERPNSKFVVPEAMGHNSWSRMMCIAQCYSILFAKEGNEAALETIRDVWMLEVESSVEDVIVENWPNSYESNYEVVEEYVKDQEYHPLVMGRLVAHEIELFMKDDGWNMEGAERDNPSSLSKESVKCTANCSPYRDTYGYYPRNHPTATNIAGETQIQENNNASESEDPTYFTVEGNDKYWQPLLEDDGKGYFSRQEHVTPHIGFHAKHKLRDPSLDSLSLPDPQYDYYLESLLVIDRLKNSAQDTSRWDKISFYDKKFLVRLLIQEAMKQQFQDTYTFEDELLFNHGIGAAEYDSILHAWRHKVEHDLVRPTTVIQKYWGSAIQNENVTLQTFNGDRKMPKVQTIHARDFQAFARVMPHSEYPSGSSCICQSYYEYVDAFTQNTFNGKLLKEMQWGYGGIDFGCDDRSVLDPSRADFLGCKQGGFVIENMAALSEECGESRLWGGMHFTKSVDAGRDLCKGLGTMGWEYVTKIRNGSDLGSTHIRGVGERPQCSTDTARPTPPPSMAKMIIPSTSMTNSPISSGSGAGSDSTRPNDKDSPSGSEVNMIDSSTTKRTKETGALVLATILGLFVGILAASVVFIFVHKRNNNINGPTSSDGDRNITNSDHTSNQTKQESFRENNV